MNPAHLTLAAVAALAAAGATRKRGSRSYSEASMYGDDEYDFPHFTVLYKQGTEPNHIQFREVAGDYEPSDSDPVFTEALKKALADIESVVQPLGLKSPYIGLADLSDDDHVARFVDGTESSRPVFLFDPERYEHLMGFALRQEIESSLLHEFGHAYLRSRGIDYEGEEEDVVEEYAGSRDIKILDVYAEHKEDYG